MTAYCDDPASAVITTVMNCLKTLYGAGLDCPPLGGSTNQVAFFSGDGIPLDEVGCEAPFLWVRLASRHRSGMFPEPSLAVSPCGALDVIVVELGIARCAGLSDDPKVRDKESEIALDDTWRLSKAMCLAASEIGDEHQVGTDSVQPYGPEGGIIAWTTTMFISV